jgi:hypothetical protein
MHNYYNESPEPNSLARLEIYKSLANYMAMGHPLFGEHTQKAPPRLKCRGKYG